MPANKGFSLLEVLLALLLSSLLVAAFLSLFDQTEAWISNLDQVIQRDQNLWTASALLPHLLLPAGSNGRHSLTPVVVTAGQGLEIKEDIDGPRGFPDSLLKDPFEDIVLAPADGNLRLASGHGSPQPVVRDIQDMEPEYHPPLLEIRLRGATARRLIGPTVRPEKSLRLLVYLWNLRPNLFRERSDP